MRDISGKVAWITGAGTGIGEGAAIALAGAGVRVVLTGRRAEPLSQVADKIASGGGEAHCKPADLTNWPNVERTAAQIGAELGSIDILFNNAGMNIPDRSWERLRPDAINDLIQANLTSAAFCTQAVLPIMREQGDGQILFTSSLSGRIISPVSGPMYTAAKHGVVALSHTVNLEECQNGIRASVVCPGEVATPIMQQRDPPEPAEEVARMVQPADLGDVIVFLARQPTHVCINEIWVTPTHNRGYIAQMNSNRSLRDGLRK